jgi:putative tricarboxylic transport membrane protein
MSGFELLLDPMFYAYVAIGVGVGMVVGIIPGLAGGAGLAILIPFVFGMDPVNGIALLIGMLAITTTSDSFASILLGVPGTAGSQATIIDGYAMTRRGEGATALGAAFTASLIGGVFGGLSLLGVAWLARPLIMAMGSPELFMLALLGITLVAIVSRGSIMVGLLTASLGMLLGATGGAPAAAVRRYTFDTLYLYEGLSIILISLGLFAIPEIIHLLASNESIARGGEVKGSKWQGARATLRNPRLVAQSSIIGTTVGIIPGLGGHVVDWLAYGAASRSVRNPTFGEGDIRGVIAPESANNAKEGGALLPTLLFAIPGSPAMAIFLGALMLMGIQPGPRMIETNASLIFAIVATLVVANIMATSASFVASGWLVRIATVPARKFAPPLMVLFAVAAYQQTSSVYDLVTLFAFGALGVLMVYLRWSRVPFIIGFVLSVPIERYLTLSHSLYGFSFLLRPTVIAIGIVMVFFAVGPTIVSTIRRILEPADDRREVAS